MYARIFLLAITLAVICGHARGQCTFSSTFASSSWHDNTKGTLTFGTTTMSGWWFDSVRATGSTRYSSWQCVNSSSDSYLVMRTQSTFSLAAGSGSTNVYAYLCMKLTKITDVSYYYYQQQVQVLNLGGDRLKVSSLSTLTQAEVCDDAVAVPSPEFHVLVKSGSESQAAVQCPDSLLFSADYIYHGSDGTAACDTTSDVWDVCSSTSEMTFDYSTCSQQILFSQGGKLYCIFSLYSGFVYTVVYNQDTFITAGLNQFACLSVEGSHVSVAPGNCTATQTPYSLPTEADGTTPTGHRLAIQGRYRECGPDEGLEPWEIALIVLSVLYFVFMCTLMAAVTILLIIYAAIVFLAIMMIYLAGHAHFKAGPRLQLPPLNIPTADTPRTNTYKAVPEIVVTTPTDIHVKNGGLKDVKNGGLTGSLEQKPFKRSDTGLKASTSNPNVAVHSKLSPRNSKQPHTSRT